MQLAWPQTWATCISARNHSGRKLYLHNTAFWLKPETYLSSRKHTEIYGQLLKITKPLMVLSGNSSRSSTYLSFAAKLLKIRNCADERPLLETWKNLSFPQDRVSL
jgi:hypothetical protein